MAIHKREKISKFVFDGIEIKMHENSSSVLWKKKLNT